jgi:hypothetical protein
MGAASDTIAGGSRRARDVRVRAADGTRLAALAIEMLLGGVRSFVGELAK